ncbi:MAG: Iron-sulfur cluster assembly protein SufD [Bacillales bacterium]|jgi:Fe-S cluster assembly protein SufD|nr:Iron-sulfur cluster assembly protein SufD [Bacillales bacterium]
METKMGLEQQEIINLSNDLQEPSWLQQLRLQALNNIEKLPLPKPDKTKIDKWNFSSIKLDMGKKADSLSGKVKTLISEEINQNLIIINKNNVIQTIQAEDLTSKGVIIKNLHDAVKENEDLVKKHLGSIFKSEQHKLSALHYSHLNSGLFIYVPKNVVIENAIQVVFVQNDGESLFNHVLLVADQHSSITYIENLVSNSNQVEEVASTYVTEVVVGDGANVTYAAIDTLAKGNVAYVSRRANVGRDAKMLWANGVMNDSNTIIENDTYLIGDGAFGDTKIVTIGNGNQIQNFTTKTIHTGKRTEGFILKHGVALEESTSIFNGIGKIEHGASKSDAEQTSRVLMLSKKARGDANPMLLIDENDVKAGHAASVGRIDELQMYYLMSRGISRKEAERLIILGFLAPVIEAIPVETVKKQFLNVIERKL